MLGLANGSLRDSAARGIRRSIGAATILAVASACASERPEFGTREGATSEESGTSERADASVSQTTSTEEIQGSSTSEPPDSTSGTTASPVTSSNGLSSAPDDQSHRSDDTDDSPNSSREPVCDNSAEEGHEECDDSKVENGDGCSADCTIESGYVCDDSKCKREESTPTADSDDGSPDNTTDDDAFACTPEETRPCEQHPGLDGNGQCQPGSQVCIASADGSTSSWGDCVGSVGPTTQDSCSVVGDDGNCNGEPNDSCDCQSDSDCDDGIACTSDSCTDLTCEHSLQPGFCHIDGECIAHNTLDPTSPCRFCDATLNQRAWTNTAPGTSCDDGLWCTGTDTCSGGTCQHQFSGDERCSATGPCALDACDEARDSCYEPAGTICANVTTVNRCANDECGGSSQAVELARSCTGDSPECPTEASEEVVSTTSCASDQACSDSSGRCGAALGCGDTYCDTEGSGLCWMNIDSPFTYTQPRATEYCDDLVLAGNDNWRLPTGDETESLYHGDCTRSCPDGEGLGLNGCYWPTEMGDCGDTYYWTNDDAIVWIPRMAQRTIYGEDNRFAVRCVTSSGY